MTRINALIGIVFAFAALNLTAKDIVGQKADYLLDKDPNRTMKMIKSGTVTASVVNFQESGPTGPTYEVSMDYHFKVSLMGNYDGTQSTNLEEEFFTPQFIENLRKTGHYEGPYFKADHKGYADAKTMDGNFYPHCDKVLLYDLKNPNPFMDMLAESVGVTRADLKDGKVLAHIYPGIPVLGAVKIDMSGVSSGMNVKAGGDYVAP